MPRLAPRLAIGAQTAGQLGNVHAAQPDEDRQAHPAHAGKRVRGGGGHPHRRVRPLNRARGDGDVGEPKEPAVVAERLALPRLEDDLERLEEARLALLVRDAEGVVAPRAAAPADAEIEAPLAQVIERRDLAGDAQGMVQGQELHGRAHAHAPGPGGDPARDEEGGRQHRAGRVDQHLGQPDDVEPPRLRRVHQLEHLQKRVGLAGPAARLFQEYPEVHGRPPVGMLPPDRRRRQDAVGIGG